MWTFNDRALPNDVRIRFNIKKNQGLIAGNTIAQPYQGGFRYHLQGNENLDLADETLYIMQNPDIKAIMRDPVSCEDDTHAGVWAWYSSSTQFMYDQGFYVHPIWCFRSDHGGIRGFTAGDDPDDDLPWRMGVPLSRMAQPVYCLLSKKDMFPTGSRLHKIVRLVNGDGYVALKAILF